MSSGTARGRKHSKQGGWFTPRGYSHLDHHISYQTAVKIATVASAVERHAFLPLISFKDEKRKFSKDNSNKSIPVARRTRAYKIKVRDLCYPSHKDSAIYSYYSYDLSARYESFLKKNSLDNCVIGYRSGLGSNINLANDAFLEILERKNCVALCFDVENFFPSIDHEILKNNICTLQEETHLSEDWYKVFRSVTKYSTVDLEKVANTEGFDTRQAPDPLTTNVAQSMKIYRANGLIVTNKLPHGIPQGTPISAQFANISMMSFDVEMSKWASERNISYRRYSDDILLIGDIKLEQEIKLKVENEIKNIKLVINPSKTEISRFFFVNGILSCNSPLTYLGFTFDGNRSMIRGRTLSKYYRRMTYAARGTIRGRKDLKGTGPTYMRSMLRDFTHAGRHSFYTYVRRAEKIMPNSIAKKQLRNHMKVLKRLLGR